MLRSLLVLSLVAPAAFAQDRATYYLIAGNDTIVAERITRTAAGFTGELADRVRGSRVTYSATLVPQTALITELTKLERFSRELRTSSSAVLALSLPALTSTLATPERDECDASARVSNL